MESRNICQVVMKIQGFIKRTGSFSYHEVFAYQKVTFFWSVWYFFNEKMVDLKVFFIFQLKMFYIVFRKKKLNPNVISWKEILLPVASKV